MGDYKHFAAFQMDVLKEMGNIGAGHATAALSKLLNKPVKMLVPLVKIMRLEEIIEVFGDTEEVVIGVLLRVEGDVPGNMFFIMTHESAKKLLHHLTSIEVDSNHHFSDMELSALQELGNILIGSYLSSLMDFTSLTMVPSVPALAIDMVGAILSYGLLELGEMGDQALFIDTKFFEGKDEVEGHFFLIPEPSAIQRIFSALGVPPQ